MQRPLPKAVRDWARRKAMDLRNPLLANHVRKWGTWQDDKLRAFALWFFGHQPVEGRESAGEMGRRGLARRSWGRLWAQEPRAAFAIYLYHTKQT